MSSIITIITLGVLLVIAGCFSAVETSFSSLNLIRIKQYAKSSKKKTAKRAKRVLKLQDKYAVFISTVLVVNNIVNLANASLTTYLFSTIYNFGEQGVLIATVVTSILVIVFGEILPKTLARVWPEKFAMFSALSMQICVVIFKPITILFGKLDARVNKIADSEDKVTATENELIDIVEKIEKEGVLEHQESELIQSAINFDSKSVRNVMTPKEEVKYVCINDDFDRITKFFEYYQYSRVPVVDEEEKKVVGVINQKDVYSCYVNNEQKNAKELLTEAIYVSHRRLIPYALELVQKHKSHLAIVVDNIKEKNFLGIITLEDILEELVGEIYDEYDDSPSSVFEIGNHIYQVNGKVSLSDLFDNYLTDTDFPKTKTKNVKDWIKEIMISVKKNIELYYDNLKISILEIVNDEVELVEIEVLTDYDGE